MLDKKSKLKKTYIHSSSLQFASCRWGIAPMIRQKMSSKKFLQASCDRPMY